MFRPYELHLYLDEVRRNKSLEAELERVQNLLKTAERFPHPDKEKHRMIITQSTQLFKTLLAEKARQKIVNEVRNNNSGDPQNSSASPADNTARGVGVRNILEQKVAGGGQ